MELKDTTAATNAESDLSEAYLLRVASPQGRWGVAIEQLAPSRYQVSVFHRDEGWDVDGVIRYWRHVDRAEAEARVLLLQNVLLKLEESLSWKEMLKALPAEEEGDWPAGRLGGVPEIGETAL